VPGDPASVPQAAVGQVLISQGAGVASVMSANPAVSGSLAIGTNPALSGAVRLANNQAVVARNAANTGNMELIKATAGDETEVGGSGWTVILAARFTYALRAEANFTMKNVGAGGIPPAQEANIYLRDNAGKLELMVQFATGAPIVLATQP
jgi:hypothetical protein